MKCMQLINSVNWEKVRDRSSIVEHVSLSNFTEFSRPSSLFWSWSHERPFDGPKLGPDLSLRATIGQPFHMCSRHELTTFPIPFRTYKHWDRIFPINILISRKIADMGIAGSNIESSLTARALHPTVRETKSCIIINPLKKINMWHHNHKLSYMISESGKKNVLYARHNMLCIQLNNQTSCVVSVIKRAVQTGSKWA